MKTSAPQIPKAYEPARHEAELYELWERSGYFRPENLPGRRGPAFAIMMPPPNVTGVMHIGHAFENALMDTKVRYERMRGRRAFIVPGTDHAAVATQARVEKDLIKQGHANPRAEYGRDKLLELIRAFAEQSKDSILSQIRSMGTSCDWSRLAYTLDAERSEAVTAMFCRMYNDALIYRGFRVVNWSVAGQSTASDDELVYVERDAILYTFRYSRDCPIPIATTRPETKLGDTAIAVHPADTRYAPYIGETLRCTFAGRALSLKVIADRIVDPRFGTGAVGVTPAHSMVDFELKERHGLELAQVIGTDGRMTPDAGGEYAGLTAEQARRKLVERLKQEGLLISEEPIKQNVATSDRFGDVIEVLPMEQWFVSVNKKIPGRNRTLKDLMRSAGRRIQITPERYRKIYFQWIDNLRDWCISRQIWWGHRVPVWYRDSRNTHPAAAEHDSGGGARSKKSVEMHIGDKPPQGTGWYRDPDTLDTWFSSGLWTFSTLGWPSDTKDLNKYHPTAWMQMGYELIFFWMARMILMSMYALNQAPFKKVFIHGMVRDQQRRKYSKSMSITLDPLHLIQKYGRDALRMGLLMNMTVGNDMIFYEEKVEHYRHFVNKLWNIARYVFFTVQPVHRVKQRPTPQSIADSWILHRLDQTMRDATAFFEKDQMSLAGESMYKFMWNDFADWYLEIAKIESLQSAAAKKAKDAVCLYVLERMIKLLHPFAPFVTEQLWKEFGADRLLMVEPWPARRGAGAGQSAAIRKFLELQDIITTIRTARSENKIPQTTAVPVAIRGSRVVESNAAVIQKLARCKLTDAVPAGKVIRGKGFSVFINVSQGVSDKKHAELRAYIERLEAKLSDTEFLSRAPAQIIEQEKKKLADARSKLEIGRLS